LLDKVIDVLKKTGMTKDDWRICAGLDGSLLIQRLFDEYDAIEKDGKP